MTISPMNTTKTDRHTRKGSKMRNSKKKTQPYRVSLGLSSETLNADSLAQIPKTTCHKTKQKKSITSVKEVKTTRSRNKSKVSLNRKGLFS